MPRGRITAFLLAIMLLFAASQCVQRNANVGVVNLTNATDVLEQTLDSIAYTSPKEENSVIYQISFRTCPPCIRAHDDILPQLREAGIETRLVTTARNWSSTAHERAAVVENARRKDWSFTQDWWADKSPKRFYAKTDLPPIEGDVAREAELERLQDHVYEIVNILARNGEDFAFPTLIWQTQDGSYKASVGYNPALTEIILSDIGPG